MRKNILMLLVVIFIAGCKQWDGSYKQLPEYGKFCAKGWVSKIEDITKVENTIKSHRFTAEKVLILKGGSEGWERYSFIAILKLKNRVVAIINAPRGNETIVIDVNKNIFETLAPDLKLLTEQSSQILTGETRNISHIPCEFLYYKVNQQVYKVSYIGYFENPGKISRVLNELWFDARKTFESDKKIYKLPPASRLYELEQKIEADLFFEVQNLDVAN